MSKLTLTAATRITHRELAIGWTLSRTTLKEVGASHMEYMEYWPMGQLGRLRTTDPQWFMDRLLNGVHVS